MKNKNVFLFLYSICFLFSLGAALNEGFTKFFWGIPFYLAFFIIGKRFQVKWTYYLQVITITALSITCSLTLTRNPLLYPILSEGTLTVLEDGFIKKYSDQSAAFTLTDVDDIDCSGCGQTVYYPVKKDQRIKVLGIKLNYPDFSLDRNFITEYGHLSERSDSLIPSHKVSGPLLTLGNLMYYPALPLMIAGSVQGLFIRE